MPLQSLSSTTPASTYLAPPAPSELSCVATPALEPSNLRLVHKILRKGTKVLSIITPYIGTMLIHYKSTTVISDTIIAHIMLHMNDGVKIFAQTLLRTYYMKSYCVHAFIQTLYLPVHSHQPLRNLLSSVGGTSVMLGLVAMATSVDALYASMKALVCIVGNNQVALKEMERTGGFQVYNTCTVSTVS